MTSPAVPAGHAAEGEPRSSRFRGDIEGLRAVAVGLVLLYHAGLPFIHGGFVGVDVFFVISGFLITTQLLSEVDRTGTVSLVRFYARRAKRLLPAAGVVLVVTALLTWWFIPDTRWKEIGGDIAGSALYVVNWRLAARSVDYLAEDAQPSPVQHFWSLAVEEQYYLVWPLLILLAVLAAKMIKNRTRPALWTGLLLVMVPSFAWSLIETAQTPASAFFVTTTRMWELGVGAAVALAAGACARLPRMAAVVFGWAGLAAIAVSGLFYTEDIAWPGYAAALPVIGAAAVIAAGFAVTRGGPASLLGVRPMRWIGGLSYSLYLWHWPLIVVSTVYFDGLSSYEGLAVVAVSVVPAWLTYRTVESGFRHSAAVSRSTRLALSLGANFTLIGVAAGIVLVLLVPAVEAPGAKTALGAAALRDDPRGDPAGAVVDRVDWMTPDPARATADLPPTYADKCHQQTGKSEVITCRYGDPKGRITVAVVGDSKISQWVSALQPLAEQNGWQLVTYLKSACSFSTAVIETDGPACRAWGANVLKRLQADPPDWVVTSQVGTQARDADGKYTEAAMVAGLRDVWGRVRAMGSKVIVIANNPHPGQNVYECVAKNPDKLSACSFDRKAYDSSSAVTQHTAAKGMKGVEVVDLFDAICPAERCPAVIGNVLMYRQGSHLTGTYIRSMTPRLAKALTKAHLRATYQKEG
ncbi:acyltransferase family protein [Planotetraspora kaengkrachanensis]|nr:acyltransferase family protein [Planotetraspora kaengkrachanensis]